MASTHKLIRLICAVLFGIGMGMMCALFLILFKLGPPIILQLIEVPGAFALGTALGIGVWLCVVQRRPGDFSLVFVVSAIAGAVVLVALPFVARQTHLRTIASAHIPHYPGAETLETTIKGRFPPSNIVVRMRTSDGPERVVEFLDDQRAIKGWIYNGPDKTYPTWRTHTEPYQTFPNHPEVPGMLLFYDEQINFMKIQLRPDGASTEIEIEWMEYVSRLN